MSPPVEVCGSAGRALWGDVRVLGSWQVIEGVVFVAVTCQEPRCPDTRAVWRVCLPGFPWVALLLLLLLLLLFVLFVCLFVDVTVGVCTAGEHTLRGQQLKADLGDALGRVSLGLTSEREREGARERKRDRDREGERET